MRHVAMSVVVGLLLAVWQQPAAAQRDDDGQRFRDRPATSPFLNLFRGDTDPAFNYHRLVRPEQEFRAYNARNRRSMRQLQRNLAASMQVFDESAPLPELGGTGHPTFFMNYLGYYQLGAGRGRSIGGGGRGRTGFARPSISTLNSVRSRTQGFRNIGPN